MDNLGQAAALAVVCALCAAAIKKQVPELALTLALAGVTGIFLLVCQFLSPIRALMDTLADKAELSPAVLAPVVKVIGLGLLSRVSAGLCRDAGESGLAAAVETAGGILALWVTLPLFEAVLGIVLELL